MKWHSVRVYFAMIYDTQSFAYQNNECFFLYMLNKEYCMGLLKVDNITHNSHKTRKKRRNIKCGI